MNSNSPSLCASRGVTKSKYADGFTLVELVVAVALVGLLYTLAAPSLLASFEKARGRRCGANLLLMENVKETFLLEHPDEPLTRVEQLLPYLRNGLPKCPSGGSYSNLADAYARCACSMNEQTASGGGDGVHDSGF